jgi:hypothetical protein
MKPYFLLFLFALTSVTLAQAGDPISRIRAEVRRIDGSAHKFRKQTRSVEGISLEGTEATYFTENGRLRKITARIFGESFRATAELYYANEKLIFVFQRVERYNGHFASDPPPKTAGFGETRAYFNSGIAFRVLKNDKVLPAGSADLHDALTEIERLADDLRRALVR